MDCQQSQQLTWGGAAAGDQTSTCTQTTHSWPSSWGDCTPPDGNLLRDMITNVGGAQFSHATRNSQAFAGAVAHYFRYIARHTLHAAAATPDPTSLAVDSEATSSRHHHPVAQTGVPAPAVLSPVRRLFFATVLQLPSLTKSR